MSRAGEQITREEWLERYGNVRQAGGNRRNFDQTGGNRENSRQNKNPWVVSLSRNGEPLQEEIHTSYDSARESAMAAQQSGLAASLQQMPQARVNEKGLSGEIGAVRGLRSVESRPALRYPSLEDPVDLLLGPQESQSLGDVYEKINPDGSTELVQLPLSRLDRYQKDSEGRTQKGKYGQAPSRPYSGKIVVPARGKDGSWRNPDGTPRTVELDPSMILFTREPAKDQRGFPESITLAQRAQELMDEYKTEAVVEQDLRKAETRGLFTLAEPNKEGVIGYLKRPRQTFTGQPTPRAEAPLQGFMELLRGPDSRPMGMAYEEIPVYGTNIDGLYRVGYKYNRNWGAIGTQLLDEIGGDLAGRTFSYDAIRQQAAQGKKHIQMVAKRELINDQEAGVQFGDPDEEGLIRYTRPDGAGGVLVPELWPGAERRPTGRYIRVADQDIQRYTIGYGPGQFIDSGTRGFLKSATDLPGHDLTLPDIIQALADQADGPTTAPVNGAPVVDALRFAREKGVDISPEDLLRAAAGKGPNGTYSTTQAQLLRDALQSAKNADVTVQPVIPGMRSVFVADSARGRLSPRIPVGMRRPDPTSLYGAFAGGATPVERAQNRLLRSALVTAMMPTRKSLGVESASDPGATKGMVEWEESRGLFGRPSRDEALAAVLQPFATGEEAAYTSRRKGATMPAFLAAEMLLAQAQARKAQLDAAAEARSEYKQPAILEASAMPEVVRDYSPVAESDLIDQDEARVNNWSDLADDRDSGSPYGMGYQSVRTPGLDSPSPLPPRQSWIPGMASSPAELQARVDPVHQRMLDYWDRAGRRAWAEQAMEAAQNRPVVVSPPTLAHALLQPGQAAAPPRRRQLKLFA